jgi:hypothetical protein
MMRKGDRKPIFDVKWHRLLAGFVFVLVLSVALLSGPGATRLQMRDRVADPNQSWDAVYLVCGARAQTRRINALTEWIEKTTSPPAILVGHDPQPSLWSRKHQRNLTRTEWGVETLKAWKQKMYGSSTNNPDIRVVPGHFDNTDGEMQALASFLKHSPYRRVALITSRFHTRRVASRLAHYAPDNLEFAFIPGLPYWENRAPWIVAIEYLKLLRDALGGAQAPIVSRQSSTDL